MKKPIIKNLKLNLFLFPTIVILISFFVILITFNIVINKYIENTVLSQLKDEFEVFEDYDSNVKYNEFIEENDNFIVPVNYLIMDDNYKIIYPADNLYSNEDDLKSNSIAKYFKENKDYVNKNLETIINVENKTYYMKTKIYEGDFYDKYLSFEDNTKKSKFYTVCLYSDISQIQNFLNVLNFILIVLMLASGIISILVIYKMAKKIDSSFNELKTNIIKIGKREGIVNIDTLPYEEFDEVAKTVENMSKMIDRAENSQKKFFQNASHELRTPLMSIQGYAEAIKSGIMENEKALDIIIKESEKMSKLVDEILFLSKMEVDNNSYNKDILDIKELIYDCSWSIKATADKKNIIIEHKFLDDNIEIYGDEQKLEKAFLNILSNAVRYTKTKILIECELKNDVVVTRIIDDGNGIDKDDLPHIFERFYKGHSGNFGIGLSITNEIIKQHNGSIAVSSVVGETIFSVELPVYKYN